MKLATLQKKISGLGRVSSETKKTVCCALAGHPPIVNCCFGQVTCARCGDILGDTLAGAFSLRGYYVRGHDCEECRKVRLTLAPEDMYLTDLEG